MTVCAAATPTSTITLSAIVRVSSHTAFGIRIE